MLKEGTKVHIYDAAAVGCTTGTLIMNVEGNRWIVLSKEGRLLDRIVEDWQELSEVASTL